MVVYDNPKTLEGELCIGFYGEAMFQAMLWEKKRQDQTQEGPLNTQGHPTYATFVDEQEVIDSGQAIRHIDNVNSEDDERDASPGLDGLALA